MNDDESKFDEQDDEETEDFDLFRQQMQDVTPLQQSRRGVEHQSPKQVRVKPRRFDADIEARFAEFSGDELDYDDVPEILSFSRAGIQHSKLAKLRQGKLQVEESIDLHGSTISQAREYLVQFLEECCQRNLAVVRIVHGKGNRSRNQVPVIKANLNRWLRDATEVLAFHSAPQHDGGSGAVYVLLKRS